MRDKKEEYKYSIILTGKFKKHLKNLKKQKKDLKLLESIVSILAKGEKLPPKNKDNKLVNNYDGARECHITPDWLLIYEIVEDKLILIKQFYQERKRKNGKENIQSSKLEYPRK